jgi:hypothetical protein
MSGFCRVKYIRFEDRTAAAAENYFKFIIFQLIMMAEPNKKWWEKSANQQPSCKRFMVDKRFLFKATKNYFASFSQREHFGREEKNMILK